MPFPYIFTFYSYKGGVGRSMALLNVAYALAGKGRHVLMVDMDLEAPGLSGFFFARANSPRLSPLTPKISSRFLPKRSESIRKVAGSRKKPETSRT
jgi:cellulose biosynthesis protein BcsQ